MEEVGVHEGDLPFNKLLNSVRKRCKGRAGAIICFIGVVREKGLRGGRVLHLEYECYRELAERKLREIRDKLISKHKLAELFIHHMVGKRKVGEDAIYIIAAGAHRQEAIEAVREAIDLVKREAPIWKREVTETGSYWISELPTSAS